jgi:hypothetical protein
MAQGDLLGTLTGNGASVTNPSDATGSVSVSVGDLIFAVFGEQTNLTTTGATDNLGHTYTAQNAGSDGGVGTGRAFYKIVTSAGTLTTVSFAATASSDNYACFVAVLEGPFTAIDTNVANGTTDTTSPHTCPASGTLSQAAESVVCWGVGSSAGGWGVVSATSPNLLAGQAVEAPGTPRTVIGYQTVAATTSVAPEFTSAANPNAIVLGTCSFTHTAGASGHPAAKRMGGVQFVGDYRSGGGFKLWRNLLIPNRGLVYG